MTTNFPTIEEVRTMLAPLPHGPMQRLSRLSGVPFHTLWKIKDGTTKSPGYETVCKFLPHIKPVLDHYEKLAALQAS